ncbi:MAG: hypothetical protein WCT28_02935 [Patescibacteria group bacterium]
MDIELEERGPNLFVVVQNANAVRRLVVQGVDRPRKVRRNHYKPITATYADADGFMTIYEIFLFTELWIKKEVAEEMIRSGELIMAQAKEIPQQDLYWRDDPWFQQNRAFVLQGREPYMP